MKYGTKHTAYHEAGHAVIGYRFGYLLTDITIVPDSVHYGVASLQGHFDENIPEQVEQMILILLAGHAAQIAYDPADKSDPSLIDYKKAWKLLDLMPSGTFMRLLTQTTKASSENRWKPFMCGAQEQN